MRLTLRWYGVDDPVRIDYIAQIPGVVGIVSAVNGFDPGVAWSASAVQELSARIQDAGLAWDVVESIAVSEEIKLGGADRDRHIDAWCESLRRVADAGVPVVCYNFMPVFDWMRTDLAFPLAHGATTLRYEHDAIASYNLSRGTEGLPGWSTRFSASELQALLARWRGVSAEQLWDALGYFLERVVPVATSVNVKLGVHPDDPPWPIFGMPRILGTRDAFRRLLRLVDAPANGITFCTGSLGALAENDLPSMLHEFTSQQRVHFMHCRNVARSGARDFTEVPHPSRYGDVPMRDVMQVLRASGFTGPLRPDHGRMIWGETGRAGYGLYDRALGATYLLGLWEGVAPSA